MTTKIADHQRQVVVNDSSRIGGVSYNIERAEMIVTFVRGGSYRYDSVPAQVFGQLISAESVGKEFDKLITGRYAGVKI